MRHGCTAIISIVIAVYQNEGSLTQTHQQITAIFADRLPNFVPELIFVNDGSSDGSLEELHRIRESDLSVRVISFTRNFGQMAAMLAGFKAATGAAIMAALPAKKVRRSGVGNGSFAMISLQICNHAILKQLYCQKDAVANQTNVI